MGTKKRIGKLLKMFMQFVLVFSMLFSAMEWNGFSVYAENQERANAACDTIGRPGVKVSLKKVSGGVETSQIMTSLIGKKEELIVDVVMDAEFDKGEALGLSLQMNLPYLYYGESKEILYTTNIEDVPYDQRGDQLMGIQARVVDGQDFDVSDTTKLYKGSMQITSAASVKASAPQTVRVALSFYGPVPENAAVSIEVGGGYKKYVTEDSVSCEINYVIGPGKSENSTYTLINSNLTWESVTEQVGEPVMWDKYNYMTYKVTMKNTSVDEDSYFDSFDLNFTVPSFSEKSYGVLDQDIMAWIYNENGDPIKNNDLEITDKSYVGVPSQGGVLVYDVTGKTEEELKKWDLDTYSNVSDESLVYHYTNNRIINIPVKNKRINKEEERVYYVAIPFANNFPESLNYTFNTKTYPTIYFGQGLSWSKTLNDTNHFVGPRPEMNHEKYLLDDNGNKVDQLNVAIGDTVDYYLSGFNNTGNIPAFNSVVVDTLPDNFNLQKLTIELDFDSNRPDYVPALTEWFKTDHLIEFEFQDASGNASYVDLGSFAPATDTITSKVWTLDMAGKIQSYLDAHPGYEFTGHMRFNLAERIYKNAEFNGRIIVNGVASVLQEYKNTIDTNYEMWIYTTATTTAEEGYMVIPKEVLQDEATVKTLPGVPVISTDGYHYNSTNDTYLFGDPLGVAVNEANSGFRYRLGNSSISSIIPAVFESGNLLKNVNGKYYGLIADSILFSKELLAVSEIDYVVITDTTGKTVKILSNKLTVDGEGKIVIPSSQWSGLKNVDKVQVNFKKFNANINLSDDIYMMINGKPNLVGDLTVTGSFETKYNNPSADSKATDDGTLRIEAINPQLTGKSHDASGNYSSINTHVTANPARLGVPNKEANTGYIFEVSNASNSPAGETNLSIDLSSSVGDKNICTTSFFDSIFRGGGACPQNVKGFDVSDLYLSSNHDQIGAIERIEFYDWNQNPTKDTPAVSINLADITVLADGRLFIGQDQLASMERIMEIKVIFSDFYGQTNKTNPDKLTIEVDGTTDWFDNLDAVLTFEPQNPTMSDQIKSVTAGLSVKRPSLMVHTNIKYYENTLETTHSNTSNSDGNLTRLGIPYDRNFRYRVSIENTEISVIDDADLIMTLPVNDKGGDEAHTGFHTTQVLVNKAFFDQYNKVKSITLSDRDSMNNGIEFIYDEATTTFIAANGQTLSFNADGDLNISQDDLTNNGIAYLGKVIINGKNVKLKDIDTADAWIDFYGYSDSNFGTENTITAVTENYLDGIRHDNYKMSENDSSVSTVSKMYFDTILTAGFKDTEQSQNGDRFDQTSTQVEDVRFGYRDTSGGYSGYSNDGNSFKDDSELDIGYKAMGSYMLDFRQYLNVGTNYPIDSNPLSGYLGYVGQEHQGMNYIYTQSFNTAANLEMTMNLPADKFDTYYVKVHPRAIDYLQSITVTRSDGTTVTLERKDWISEVGNGIETDSDGNHYFRINLVNDNTNLYDTVATGSANTDYYKSPIDYEAVNPVTSVVFNLNINQTESSDGVNANDPDFGSWYDPNNQKTKYMFEVTGRFYETGKAEATAATQLTVGGGRSKVRVDSASKNDRSSWSYSNTYQYKTGYWWNERTSREYDARHLKSTAWVNVRNDNNLVLKGVHDNPALDKDIDVEYSRKDYFAVSFYRESAAVNHDYQSGNKGWTYQDLDDWVNKVSFADEIYLEDTLPKIRKDETNDYYGFLTEDILISEELYQYIDRIELTKQNVVKDSGSTAVPDSSNGMKGYKTTVEQTPFITLSQSDLGVKDENNNYKILFKYKEKEADAVSNAANEIVFEQDDYLYSYKIVLKNIPGNADYARELLGNDGLFEADSHGNSSKVDIKVGGYVYLIKDINPVSDATNTMTSTLKNDYADTLYPQKTDTAYLMGFRLPFKAGYKIEGLNILASEMDYESADDPSKNIIANITPHTTTYGVKVWNQSDGSDPVKDKASRIKTVEITNNLDTRYNLKAIHIPGDFIDGTWFNVTSVKLNYTVGSTNASTVFDHDNSNVNTKDIAPYLVKSGNDYYFDVNKFIAEISSSLPTYTVDNSAESYIKEHINSFVVTMSAVNPDVEKEETLLAAAQYLSADKQEGYAITYDGVWVDRTQEDIDKNAWTAQSRPTFGLTPNQYPALTTTTTTSVKFTAADFNAENYQGNITGTIGTKNDNIQNLVGKMEVAINRGTNINSVTSFAYDRSENPDGTIVQLPVDQKHIVPYDYIDYTLSIKASNDSPIPLQHADLRFTAPDGQRIVGWKIESNKTAKISSDDITAFVKGSGTDIPMQSEHYYLQDSSGIPTNYKEMNISIGDLAKSEAENQIQAGEEVQIIVYTQMSDEQKDSDGNPAFEGKTVTAKYEAVCRPKHTYSQYSISGNGNNTGYYGDSYYSSDSDVLYYRKKTDFYRTNGTPYKGSDYTSIITSDITFKDSNNLWFDYSFNDLTTQYDGQQMTLKVSGKDSIKNTQVDVTNDLHHDVAEMIYEVSFMSKHTTSSGAVEYYKGFDLTKKPVFNYPINMTSTRPIKVEYLFDVNGVDTWVEETLVDEPTTTRTAVLNTTYLITEAKKIRWTYYDVPAFGIDGNEIVFATIGNPFVFEGLGRYNDIRENDTVPIKDRYTMVTEGKVTPIHQHKETLNNTIDGITSPITLDNTVHYYGDGKDEVSIARERPVLTYQTQIFETQEKAAANYDPTAEQKKGYRPKDTMWYKVSVINNKLNAAEAATGNQGVLLDPVFYDKVPEYVSADTNNLHVRWLSADGSVRTDAPKIQVKVLTNVNAPDYGGDMVVPKSSVKEGAGGNLTGKNFDDIIPSKDNSTEINYTVYEFSFEGNARLEVGESIEIWYEATAREDNLPMVYANDNGNIYPEYYPKMGEYYQNSFDAYYSGSIAGWPLVATGRGGSLADGRIRAVDNSGIMMDMSYLIHDVGISGTMNPNVDRWEFLADSTTYIPGNASNNPGTTRSASVYGNNNVLMDYDSASGSVYQKVKYVPSITGSDLSVMPTSTQYQGAANANRDVYKYVVQPRTNLNETPWDNKASHTPILWSEARTHLQTAWLAASSQIIPNQSVPNESGAAYANHALEYLGNGYTKYFGWNKTNPNYYYYVSDNYGQHARHEVFPDDSIPTIEYDESYNARLSAYNYGDWSLDGVEFIYVLPRGISPQMDDSGNIVISGTTLTSGDSSNGGYSAIDPGKISVEVIQNPTTINSRYLSPKKVQDPLLVQTKMNTTTDDYDANNEYYDAADAQSWVLKITVNEDLKKWFNRGSDKGYILNVDIGCHVDSTNESEYWYDKVFAKPIDSENSLYYQVYDITSWQGATKDKIYKTGYGSLSTQFAGMDYLWDGYDNANTVDLVTNYNNGSPNMPYINGFNIQNSEVSIDTDVNGVTVSGNLKAYYGSGKTSTYAATGTRAHMRKPFIRTWTTMGDDIDGKDPNAYYLHPEAGTGVLNIHVENKYYWDELATNSHGSMTSGGKDGNSAIRHLHNYSTDGGNQGTLFFPVITNILPEGVVPKDVNGDPFTKDNVVNNGMTLKWDIYDGQTKNDLNATEKDLYTTKVEYIELDKEDGSGKEGRFKVTFYQDKATQGNHPDAKIVSGDTRVYSIDLVTVKEPDKTTKDGKENSDLLAQYQSNHTYVTSQLPGFKFVTDDDIAGNPYYVGAPWYPYYAGKYNTGDNRKDAIVQTVYRPGSGNIYDTGGTLPNIPVSILNTKYEVISANNNRYNETDEFNLEDYTDIRTGVKLSDTQKDFDLSGALTHVDVPSEGDLADHGVHTSMRIRTKYARLEVETRVGNKEDSADAMRDTEAVNGVDHYPTINFDDQNYNKTDQDHKQYADHLWYNTKVSNIPENDADYMHKGDIKHAKIIVSVKLPSIVSYQEQYYLEYEDTLGNLVKLSKDDIENPDPAVNRGWQINLINTVIDPDTKEETQIFEIITPGETDNYDEYLAGKNVAGFFGTGDSFELKIKTVIDHLDTPDTVLMGDNYWDNQYYAQSYVTFHELDGAYLGIAGLTEQSTDLIEFVREAKDQAKDPADSDSKDIDYDYDGDLEERYASDTSGRVTILKPAADVRLDTSVRRNQLNNPDAGIIVAEDPSIKGATVMTVYMDEVVNRGGAVPEFVVDYRVPYRGTNSGTIYEAPMSAPELNSSIRKIRTGVWELPSQADYTGPSSIAELQNKLRVHIYALVVSDPGTFPYTIPGTPGEYTGGQWKDLGSYGLTDNQVIDVENLSYSGGIVQIRYVIKADDSTDAKATQKYPVPQGFRLDIDADPTTPNTKEEMDDIDPNRDNVKELPDSVKDNAAYVQLTTAHKTSSSVKLHANNFATTWARYDDAQYSALSSAARAGYFVNTELPAIQVDLVPYYFHRYKKEDETYGFEWSDTDMVIKQGFSTMLKYKITIKNLTDAEIAMTEFAGEEQDNATKPEISAILPYMEDIMDTKYNYVDAHSGDYADAFVNTSYTSDVRIERDQAQWTYYVEDKNGSIKQNSRINGVDFKSYKKSADLSGTDRKILTWSFDGYLEPGETIAVEFMVPIGTKDFGMISSDLLNCSGYGFLQGSFKGYIPPSENTNETYSIEIDSRDINDNGKTISEATLVKRVGGISFESKQSLNRLKFSYSEYDTSGLETTRPSLVPEGTDYNFRSVILNPDNYGEPGYKQALIYDVLPYANDKNIVNPLDRNDPDSPAANRESTWAGWVIPETIKVLKTTTPATGGTVTTELAENTDYEAWIGPFEKKANGEIVTKDISQLPAFKDTQNTEFYSKLYADENLRRQYFVKLSELKALETTNNETYKLLSKNIQAIWVQINDRNDLGLDGSMKFELNYSLHSPLNLPQYNGAVTSDMGDDAIRQNVAAYTGWNTFAVQAKASSNDNPISVVESPRAGVYLNAPVEKGYIGSYVWYDANYNADIDEGEYERRDDGRLIFKNKTKDLDYDGIHDDPGINGVLVELLSENGYPVNKLGEAVVEEEGTGKFIKIDETTGMKMTDVNGTYEYSLYGPTAYTTEADAYGNNGYFIISNVTPGNYKLRYTFPEKTYNTYALTTLEIGDTKAKMDVYRDGDTLPDLGNPGTGDVESDAQTVTNKLVVQTADSIKIEAIGSDPSQYVAYDEKMTSYNVGVSRAYVYGGTAWVDETPDLSDTSYVISNGVIDPLEKRLENVDVIFYEITDAGLVQAIDADGNPAVTKTDADGRFEMSLYPDRSYIARVDTSNTDGVYKPSPITWNTDPKVRNDDNDLILSDDKLYNQTFTLHAGVEFDTNGKPIIDTNGNFYGKFDYIGLGFVEAGRGYLGKYVWDDKNYDGIRGDYLDNAGNLISEPGIENVKFILERYYYDDVDDTWKPTPDVPTSEQITNTGGSYTFQNVKTTYTLGDKVYLAGYKIKVDPTTLPADYAVTKYQMNNGKNDSDLPILSADGYLTSVADHDASGMIIIAEKADEHTQAAYIKTYNGVDYNTADGRMILDLDIGLTTKDKASFTGIVWDDKNYDGIQNQYQSDSGLVDEPGIADVELEIRQYYYKDSQWIKNETYVSPTIKTDADGVYTADQLDSYITVDGQNYITGYKISIKDIDSQYAVTKYKATHDTTLDSNLIDENLNLTEDNEYLIVAKKITNTNYESSYIITNNLGNFDIHKVENIEHYDAGLVAYEKAILSGKIWEDKNYDGIMNQYKDIDDSFVDEPGIQNVTLHLEQYYLDEHQEWKQVPVSIWDSIDHLAVTDGDGRYQFTDTDTHVVINGQRYLAGYKVTVDKDSIPDKENYGITLYRVKVNDGERNNDLSSQYKMQKDDEYIITADKVTTGVKENTPYIIELNGNRYDLVTALDSNEHDGGLTLYQKSTISGNVFADEDYDGLYDSEEGYDDIKAALTNGQKLEVTLTSYYLDEHSQWQPLLSGGIPVERVVEVDQNGQYIFDQVPTQVYVNEQHHLAGYKLKINLIPDGFGATKYLRNSGQKDSALYKAGHDLMITKTSPNDGYTGSVAEEVNGYIVAAYHNKATDVVNNASVINGYDLIKSRELSDYNVGYTDKMGGNIIGTIFDDENYDGFFDETNEEGINGIEVNIEQYYLDDDNHWVRTDPMTDYATTLSTTINNRMGIFEFKDLPTHVTLPDGSVHLASYKVRIDSIPNDYGITHLNMRTGDNDLYDEIRDSDLVFETGYLNLNDGSDRDDENIIVAYPLQEDDVRNEQYIYSYKGQDYDILQNRTVNDYDAGLVKYKLGSIQGDVWLDNSDDLETSYNGIKDPNEKGIADQTVILSQYLLKNGKWELISAEYLTDVTDENGHYQFNDLPVYEEIDSKRYLYGYQLKLETLSEEYAVTKYRQGEDPTKDSDLNVETSSMTGSKEYVILAKNVTDDTYINKPYTIKVDQGLFAKAQYYDILVGQNNKDYSAGYTEYQRGSIEGIAFIDDDYDGIFNNSDSFKEEILVQLKRYYYNSDERKWIEDNRSPRVMEQDDEDSDNTQKPESFYRMYLTKKDGHYIFDNLETYKEIDGKCYVYGYELWIDGIPQGYAATKYQQNNGVEDSALNANTLQIIKKDSKLPEMNKGYITIAENVKAESYQNLHYTIGDYDIISAKHLTDYNVGLTTIDEGTISGMIWEDDDYNGIQHENERGLSDIEVTLETYYYQNSKWHLMENKNLTAITSADGKYEFNHLATFSYVDNEQVLLGYKVKIEALPKGYNVTDYQVNDQHLDSDLDESNGYLNHSDEYIVLAQKADASIDPSYVLNGYNFVKVDHELNLDAGLTPYKSGDIEAIIFEDENNNGIFDEGESVISGQQVMLEVMVENSQLPMTISSDTSVGEDGIYQLYNDAVATSDEEGKVKFKDIPMLDKETNELYRYRLRMIKPEQANFTYVKANDIHNNEALNVYGKRHGSDSNSSEHDGITHSFELVGNAKTYANSSNYYGLQYKPQDILKEGKLYLGLSYVEPVSNIDTGDRHSLVRIAGLMLISGLVIVMLNRKKKEEE